LIRAWWLSIKERSLGNEPQRKVVWYLLLASALTAAVAIIFKDMVEELFRKQLVVACLLLVSGSLLWLGERWSKQEKTLQKLNLMDSVVIGFAQSFALAPGISRSGVTIVAGLFQGLTREAATRFSFLLAIPVIAAAMVEEGRNLSKFLANSEIIILVVGFVTATISGYFSIKYLLRYLARGRLNIFAYYCWVAGLGFILAEVLLR